MKARNSTLTIWIIHENWAVKTKKIQIESKEDKQWETMLDNWTKFSVNIMPMSGWIKYTKIHSDLYNEVDYGIP